MPAPIRPIPFGACLEAAQVGSILPGPYVLPLLRCHTISACTNKPPILPYRGVARTGVCFAMETTLDALARQLGLEPQAIRLANLVPPEAMPLRNLVGKVFDSGDYPESLRRAVAAFDLDVHPRAHRPRARRSASAFATFCEQGAHGTSVYHAWGIPFVPGFEQAHVRLSPDGVLEVRVGVHSHGQGMETTLAQVAHEILGVASRQGARGPRRHRAHALFDRHLGQPRHGDGGRRRGRSLPPARRRASPRSARRCCRSRRATSRSPTARCAGPADKGGSVAIADVAHTWYRAPQNLPPGVNKGGLEVTAGYRPDPEPARIPMPAMPAWCAVDTETGAVVLEDYLVVEDGGKLVNPMIVDGQVLGGLAQGIGTALYEEMPYDEAGPAAGGDAGGLSAARRDRRARRAARPHGNASAPGPPSARRASARAARSARRARSSTPSTTRWRRSAPRFWTCRPVRRACWRRSRPRGPSGK